MGTGAQKVLTKTPFEIFLDNHDDKTWSAAIKSLLGTIHEVDQTAVQIWFAFYPLSLLQVLDQAEDPEKLARQLLLQGNYYLRDQVDSSHKFVYGHRFWPEVKKAVGDFATSFDPATAGPLPDQILTVAMNLADRLQTDVSLLVAITAVAFMSVQQAGLKVFTATPGQVLIDRRQVRKSPGEILKKRAKDNSQGLLGFLKTVDKKWTVTYDENDQSAKYTMNHIQDLAWGAADDRSRNWQEIDARRIEGPIPVECRSASCGTCWVGIQGGAAKLSDVAARESKQIKNFGYIDTAQPRPLIRLACQAQAHGAVSIVIPPWNGVFGKYLREKAEDN